MKLGKESVWDYPRPPRLADDPRLVVVRFRDQVVARTRRSIRVLETSHPPGFYIPPDDVDTSLLTLSSHITHCEFKGKAVYWDLAGGHLIPGVAWSYPEPAPGFGPIANWFSFYPSKVECSVAGELVEAQQGGFYGGWITSEIVGPFKGGPGTAGW